MRHLWVAKGPLKFPKWRGLGVDVVLENQLTESIAPDLNQCVNQSSMCRLINQSINRKEVQPRQAEGRKDSRVPVIRASMPTESRLNQNLPPTFLWPFLPFPSLLWAPRKCGSPVQHFMTGANGQGSVSCWSPPPSCPYKIDK